MPTAKALLLGERLDHRGLAASDAAVAADPVPLRMPDGMCAFAFRWGAIVLFNVPPAQEASLVEALRPRLHAPLPAPIEEIARVEPGAEADTVDADGVIRLRDLAQPRLAVVADALAKNAALAQQEATVAAALDRVEPFLRSLQENGRLVGSPRDLMRQIGRTQLARSRTAARVEAEDKPEVLWDYPALERLHARLADEYELRERVHALDRKYTLIGDIVATLLSMLDGRRAMRLELAIVVLVAVEVVMGLYEFLR